MQLKREQMRLHLQPTDVFSAETLRPALNLQPFSYRFTSPAVRAALNILIFREGMRKAFVHRP